jgi:hypothetical protein
MPSPWTPDATKDATLTSYQASLTTDDLITAETAWHMVQGQTGFAFDNWDDLAYCRFNWPRIYGS